MKNEFLAIFFITYIEKKIAKVWYKFYHWWILWHEGTTYTT